MGDAYRMSGGRRFRYDEAGRPVIEGPNVVAGADLSGLEEIPDEVADAVLSRMATRPEEMERLRPSLPGGPTRDERPPQSQTWSPPQFEDAPAPAQRPAVAARPPPPTVRPGAAVDTSEMLARYSGVTQDKSSPDSMPAVLKSLMGAAQPRALASMANEHPAVQKVLAEAGFVPKADSEMERARGLQDFREARAYAGSGLDALNAALTGGKDDGSGLNRRMHAAQMGNPVERLNERRVDEKRQFAERRVEEQLQAERAKSDPDSDISTRAREMVATSMGVPVASIGRMSAAEVEKYAPLIVKRIEAEAARTEKRTQHEEDRELRRELAGEASKDRRYLADALRGQKDDVRTDKEIETLSKRMEQAPALRNDLATLNKFSAEKDIPGVGSIAGRLPDWMVSQDGTRVRQAAKGIIGTVMKEQSGTAASDKEVERKMAELGMGDGATEEQFRLGLQRLTGNVRDLLKAKEAGARPAAVTEARRRGLTTSADIPSGTVRVTNGKETLEIDAADLADAQRDGFAVLE